MFSLGLDVRDLDQIRRGVAAVEKEFNRIDILVNNAGINHPSPGLKVDQENWEDHFNTNVRGGFFCAQAVAKGMIEHKFGRIIFISSQSGLVGILGQPVYCATKGAMINLVRSFGIEWGKYRITVNSVAPTFIETDLTRKRLRNPEFLKFMLGKIPCINLSVDGGWTAW